MILTANILSWWIKRRLSSIKNITNIFYLTHFQYKNVIQLAIVKLLYRSIFLSLMLLFAEYRLKVVCAKKLISSMRVDVRKDIQFVKSATSYPFSRGMIKDVKRMHTHTHTSCFCLPQHYLKIFFEDIAKELVYVHTKSGYCTVLKQLYILYSHTELIF